MRTLVPSARASCKHVHHHEQSNAHACLQVLLFVVGGVGLGELRAAREVVAERAASAAAEGGRPPPRVILGGTALLAPEDVVARLLGA